MDLSELSQTQLYAAMAGAAFVFGALVMRAFSALPHKESSTEDPRNHRIRELEADLRTARRQFDECQQALDAKCREFEQSVESLREVRTELAERDEDLARVKEELRGSVAKTRELRTELQERATETVRVRVRAEEAETELEVARAGSEAVLSEISRLQEERENLTNSMRQLEDTLLPDDDLLASK